VKIYTRTGDSGETGLFAGGRISKGHARLHAYGTVDELNAVLGLALAAGLDEPLREAVQRVQGELFVIGADLATPLGANAQGIVRATAGLVRRLENEIDTWQAGLPALKHFILPGGSMAGAFLHQARTVGRRAERWLVVLNESEAVNPETLRYLNRLSDWLFVAARVATLRAGLEETIWQPSASENG
jgi:cob(I)alamin adenosyltransferase